MGVLNLDFSNVPNREPLEPGWYTARIENIEEKQSSTGNPMLVFEYLITGDADGNTVEGNRKVWENIVLIDKCLFRMQALLKACEIAFDPTEIVDLDTDELLGMELAVKLVQDTYQGDIKNSVKALKSLSALQEG